MGVCISAIPIGANMRFTMEDGQVFEGRLVHNYGIGVVLMRSDGSMMEFKGTSAKIVETMDAESASLWRQGISKDSAEFKQFLEKISGTKEEA